MKWINDRHIVLKILPSYLKEVVKVNSNPTKYLPVHRNFKIDFKYFA